MLFAGEAAVGVFVASCPEGRRETKGQRGPGPGWDLDLPLPFPLHNATGRLDSVRFSRRRQQQQQHGRGSRSNLQRLPSLPPFSLVCLIRAYVCLSHSGQVNRLLESPLLPSCLVCRLDGLPLVQGLDKYIEGNN